VAQNQLFSEILAAWVPNAMAGLVITPFVLGWQGVPDWRRWPRARWGEALLCAVGLWLGTWISFQTWFGYGIQYYPLAYLPYPFLVWASLRFGLRGAATGMLVVSAVAIYALLHGRGPFVAPTERESVLLIGSYIIVLTVTNLILAAAVTERQLAVEALDKSQEMFSLITNNTTDLIAVTDATGKRLYNSASYRQILGDPHQLQGTNAFEDIHPEDRARIQQVFQESLRTQTGQRTEFRFLLRDGRVRYIESLGNYVRGDPGQPGRIVTVARDITERKQIEEQLRQSQKMEAVGSLAGGIAHDFNNLLSSIMGYTELARLDWEARKPGVREHLEAVLQASRTAKGLIQQILTFSRQGRSERKPILLQPVVKEVMKLMRSTLPTTIEMDAQIAPEAPLVLADAIQVHQVLMNLCTNAGQAMKDRLGRLEVGLERFEVTEALAREHPELRPGIYACLTVKDSGHGMTAETMKRIFDPFFTTKAAGEGTGLGLSVVHGIVKEHEGAILVSSAPDQGATFRVFFPVCAQAAPLPETNAPKLQRGDGQRILLVDDERMLGEMVQQMLEYLNYRVTMVVEAEQALARFQHQPWDFDLVITDLIMPKMTGVSLAVKLRDIRPDLPIILMTGYSSTWSLEKARSIGIRDLVMKPFTYEVLATAVHRVWLPSPPTTGNPGA
jgi:PAS domain S-box-containing protein